VELTAKLTLPLMNLVVCLVAFVGSAQSELRGHLRGLGISLGWGLLYYVVVAIFQGIAKEWRVPVVLTVWVPHVAAIWWCVRRLRLTR
jgi:lipopolysaccharide export LptBFGC system permease protein LptF